ncbi:MAG TPA: hypothetical protein VHL53_23045 [Acidimicrobiia bacterium]|nr:hypothetical protein [Acidimicrobiia bacterium]
MPRAAKPTRLPGSGLPSPTSDADWFVKHGDFQSLAAGRPMMFYRDPAKARADWLGAGWRQVFEESFPTLVPKIDTALDLTFEEGDAPGPDGPAS